VARRARVSHAAPYKHFPDKAALLAEMALVGFDRLREMLTRAKPRNPSTFRDKFSAVARAYARFGTSNPALYRLMFSADGCF
jgi:AcrR family transcriptional regulator